MNPSTRTTLEVATADQQCVLERLVQLYAHDLSDVFRLELDDAGRYEYERLRQYWEAPDRNFPFLIRSDGRLAGFALITRGSPASPDPNALDVAEFFVAKRHRGEGVGREAAFLLWDRFPGRWFVRVSEGNEPARRFWARVVAEYSHGAFDERTRDREPHRWRIFAFESAGAR